MRVTYRCDHLPSLANLHVVRYHSRVDRGPGSANGGAHQIRQVVEHLEVVATLHPAPAAYHDLGARQLGPVRLAQLLPHELRVALDICANLDLAGAAAGALVRVERSRPNRDHLDGILAPQRHDGVAGVDGPHERFWILDADDVGNGRDVEDGGDARQNGAADGRRAGEDVAELELVLRGEHDRGEALGEEAFVSGILGHNDFGESADRRELLGHVAAFGSGHEDRDVAADGLGGRDRMPGSRIEFAAVVLGEHEGRLQPGGNGRQGGEL